ncbi:RuvX/YqgF family protein [Candidatus Parcubacteria bacterium]|nr:RuvX/YqgF family protein [Candidatus Parcubacteria bacterium]
MMRLMGIDYGSKKVGVASTDSRGEFALPRAVLPNDHHLVSEVVKMCEAEGVERVILGESKDFKGEPNDIQAEIAVFKQALEDHGIEVVLHPEMLTSLEAKQLQGENAMLDASAAALILKSYIDSRAK